MLNQHSETIHDRLAPDIILTRIPGIGLKEWRNMNLNPGQPILPRLTMNEKTVEWKRLSPEKEYRKIIQAGQEKCLTVRGVGLKAQGVWYNGPERGVACHTIAGSPGPG